MYVKYIGNHGKDLKKKKQNYFQYKILFRIYK